MSAERSSVPSRVFANAQGTSRAIVTREPQPLPDLEDGRLAAFRSVVGRRRGPLAVVEGALPVTRACASGVEVESVVCTTSHVDALRACVPEDTRWWCAPKQTLAQLLGYPFHRGVVATVRVPTPSGLTDAVVEQLGGKPAPLVAAAIGLTDPANVGALVRAACAFGVDHLLLDARAADPFSRKAIRASAGHVFSVQATTSSHIERDVATLAYALQAQIVALTPGGDTVLSSLTADRPRVVLFGSEGPGLDEDWINRADVCARIPMSGGIDSLNVAAASAVTFYALTSS